MDLDKDQLRALMENASDDIIQAHNTFKHPDTQMKFVHQESPAILPLVVDCANYCRLSYGVPTLPDNFKEATLDKARSLDVSVHDKKIKNDLMLFNESLKYYKGKFANMSDNIEILELFEIKDLGGTSYMAADHDKKYLIVAFKGTKTKDEWYRTNYKITGTPYKPLNPWGKTNENLVEVKIHEGFYEAIANLQKEKKIFEILKGKLDDEKFKSYKLIITGHSLGGALSALFGIEAQILGWTPLVVTLASPKIAFVGRPSVNDWGSSPKLPEKIGALFQMTPEKVNQTKDDLDSVLKSNYGFFINIAHTGDIVPLVPPSIFFYERLGGIPYKLTTPVPEEIVGSFKAQRLELDADDDLHEIKENVTFAKKTYEEQKIVDDKVEKNNTFPAGLLEFLEHWRNIMKYIGDILDFLNPFGNRLSMIHNFYTLFHISLEQNAIRDFTNPKAVA